MIHVDLDKILTAKALQEHLSTILFEVEEKEELYVITKKGRPRAALINVDYLQELTGKELGESREYDRYPASPPVAATSEPTMAGIPQSTADIPPATSSVLVPQAPAQTEPEEVTYPDLDIDSLEIPEEEPETAEPITEVVAPPAATPPTAVVTPSTPNLAPTPDQVPPPAAPTPSQ